MLVLFAWLVVVFAFMIGWVCFSNEDPGVSLMGTIIALIMAYFPLLYIFGGGY
ncbi:hypothetical protein P9695_08875 [Weizmannia sp. CD-2023]|uniref:hypothetical protein n=1 Tax=Heyndrickxia TaxID=2837504 RepID=UPI002E25194B|nr:hypothetical protein [Weizmannia sp. CD-2023]MED4899734.1 hypothetical protein [Weizmannia sp. CD-2023]